LSDSVSVITAGAGPSEAEILAYAKELGLSPDAIKALMAELQANGLLGDQPLAEMAQGQVEPLPVGAQPVAIEDATSRWLSSRGQLAGSTELTNGSVSGQTTAGLKGDGSELGQSFSDGSTKDGQSSAESPAKSSDALTKLEKLLGPGALKEMLMGKAAERAMANEAMMKTALIKDSAVTGPLGFETIDLSEFAAELSNPFDRPALSASPPTAGAFGLQASMGDSSGRSMAGDTGTRQDVGGGAARTFSAQLSQRFGEILGQRLLQQISQGNWKVELNLEPGDLGSIKVEMEFKKGELEASFKAGQAMTKDLLQDTLPRLREALERSGITIASMNVGGDRQERSGDSLSQQHSSASARRQPDSPEGDAVELEKAVVHRSHDGSLDVLV
ncbi:MAG: flagellar hook-length control protein FliK, partial [Burkholderiaceae bacterium]